MTRTRWNVAQSREVVVPHVDAFLEDIIEVYKKHNLTLGHEDEHGAFRVHRFDLENIQWLRDAQDCRDLERK